MNSEQLAQQRLKAAGRTKDRARRAAWLTLVAALVLIAMLAVAVADYWMVLPMGIRFGGLLVVTGLVAVGTIKTVRLLTAPTPMKEAALDVEARDPRLGCMVSTAAEYLSGERKPTQEYEPQLVAALEQEAAKAMYRVKVPYWKSLRLPLGLLACAMLILLGFFAFSTGASTALKRVASPWTPVTYTRVEVKPGDAEVPVGRDLDIESAFSGRPPADPRFHWQAQGEAKWHKTALTTNDAGSYVYSIKAVRTPFTYRVTGGDGSSPDFRVNPYIPPEVKELGIQLNYPAYVGREPVAQNTPDVTILRGSVAEFKVLPNVELKKARLLFEHLPPVDLLKGPEGSWVGNFTITTNADYWIELTDLRYHLGTNTEPHHLKALPDEPPKVEITEPGQDIRAEATNTIALKLSVTDDYGVGEIRIKYNKLGGPEQTLVVDSRETKKGEIQAAAQLALADLKLKDYEVVAYHAEALDHNDLDGPGVGRSPVYFIEITNEKNQPNPSPPSPGQSPKVNLLVVQKQIIADTKALAKNSAPDKFKELAEREKTAQEFAQMYQQAMDQLGAPAEAKQEMEQALADLKKATDALEKPDRDTALPPEEGALAHMYQLLKMMPELQNLPTQPSPPNQQPQNPMMRVVMEAIKQKQEQQPNNQELSALTGQVEQLSQAQAALNEALEKMAKERNANENASGQPPPAGQQPPKGSQPQAGQQTGQPPENGAPTEAGPEQPGQTPPNEQKPDSAQKDGKGQQAKASKSGPDSQKKGGQGQQPSEKKGGKAGGQKSDEPQPGAAPPPSAEKPPGTGAKPDAQQPGKQGQGNAPSLEELAKQEEQLSKEGQELAEKLDKLAGKDKRLGHNVSKTLAKAAGQMQASAKSLKGGQPGKGFSQAQEGGYGVNTVAAMLQKILELEKQLTDTSAEDFPKEYEAAIQEYLKRLSHEE